MTYRKYPFYVIVAEKIVSGWDFREDADDAVDELEDGVKAKTYTAKFVKQKGWKWTSVNPCELKAS